MDLPGSLHPPAGETAPRTLAGRYRLERKLGSGGMATVYRAEDLKHRRPVAVKVLHAELAGSISAERFLREIEIVAQLLHPHILTLIDSGADDGALYYVMPFVEGESLRERLDREGELPIDDAVRILRELADALAYAHRRGIVHRDVKPENVLLTGRHALVADFGIAKACASALDDAGRAGARPGTLTGAGTALGTPAYMAPEQAAGDPHADGRADLYAAGVVAYEMLVGAPPFAGPSPQRVMAMHLTQDPEPVTRRRPEVPPAVEQVVMRCLAKRPADRWRDGEEILHRLDALAATPTATGAARRAITDGAFRLTEEVCRQLDRATLDPRIIGGELQYRDNGVASPVLVCFLHGTGYDARQFDAVLERTPHRALAPTLHGFEPTARRRAALSLDNHLLVLGAFLRDAVARLRPATTVLVGFSSAGDLVLRLLAAGDDAALPPIDGAVAAGANLSLETCFVTRLFARMSGGAPERLLADLRALGDGAGTLEEWINVHEYLVTTLRKFHGDIAPLRRFSADIVQPFAEAAAGGDAEAPFAAWYRLASARVRRLRCVFEDTDEVERPLRALRLRNLDAGVLGPAHRDDAIVVEPGTDHFDLVDPARLLRHVDEVVAAVRRG